MRLIDADALSEVLLTENQRCITSTGHELTMSMIVSFIQNHPTAFDTEQVIHNLECEKTIWCGRKITTTEVMKIDDAIDIVKKGGVE